MSNNAQVVNVKTNTIYAVFKRGFDVVFSLHALIALALPLLIIALIVIIDSPGASPIYVQQRVGKNGKTFAFLWY